VSAVTDRPEHQLKSFANAFETDHRVNTTIATSPRTVQINIQDQHLETEHLDQGLEHGTQPHRRMSRDIPQAVKREPEEEAELGGQNPLPLRGREQRSIPNQMMHASVPHVRTCRHPQRQPALEENPRTARHPHLLVREVRPFFNPANQRAVARVQRSRSRSPPRDRVREVAYYREREDPLYTSHYADEPYHRRSPGYVAPLRGGGGEAVYTHPTPMNGYYAHEYQPNLAPPPFLAQEVLYDQYGRPYVRTSADYNPYVWYPPPRYY
jgi:hypothetical protein